MTQNTNFTFSKIYKYDIDVSKSITGIVAGNFHLVKSCCTCSSLRSTSLTEPTSNKGSQVKGHSKFEKYFSFEAQIFINNLQATEDRRKSDFGNK